MYNRVHTFLGERKKPSFLDTPKRQVPLLIKLFLFFLCVVVQDIPLIDSKYALLPLNCVYNY